MGLDPGSPGSRPGPKAGAKPLSHPGITPPALHFLKAGLATPSESNEQRHDVMRQVFSSSQFWVAHIWALQVVLMVTVGDALERIPDPGSQIRHVQDESCFSAVDTGETGFWKRVVCALTGKNKHE